MTPATVCPPCDEVLAAAHLAVLRALELVGRRMVPRSAKNTAPEVAVWARHTVLAVDGPAELDRLMAGAWQMLEVAMPDRPDLVTALDAYTREAVYEGTAHTVDALAAHLTRAGVIGGG